MKLKFFLTTIVVSLAVLSAYGASKKELKTYEKFQLELQRKMLEPQKRLPKQSFLDLTNGVKITIMSMRLSELVTDRTYHFSSTNLFSEPIINYVKSMGFKEMNSSTDCQLFITVVRADFNSLSKANSFELALSLKDPVGKELFSQQVSASVKDNDVEDGLFRAYPIALERVDWYRIASFLRVEQNPVRVAQRPAEEPHKKVTGMGDTALEQTIIRWDVQSRPQGADLFWRVVSKTPEVKSTNNKYLNTTPYEATKTLDIKGLDYQTSGNVRIILRCEKEGYFPQEKEFDVRMILDQEEISAFFRLVKIED